MNLFKENQFKQAAQDLINDIKETGIGIIDEDEKNKDYANKNMNINSCRPRLLTIGIKKQAISACFFTVVREGFEPSKLAQQIYSLPSLAT